MLSEERTLGGTKREPTAKSELEIDEAITKRDGYEGNWNRFRVIFSGFSFEIGERVLRASGEVSI